MRAITTKLLACLIFCCLYSSIVQAQWNQLPKSATDHVWSSLTVDQRNGTVYSSHSIGKILARRLNAEGQWEFLGPETGLTPGNSYWHKLAVDDNGTAYIAFTDNAEGGKASVMRYNEGSLEWEYVGPPHISSGTTSFTTIKFDNDNVPYVAFRDADAPEGDVKVLRYDADENMWVDPITGSSSAFTSISKGTAAWIDIAFSNNNTLYVAYQDGPSTKATVKKLLDGANSYEVVGTENFSETASEYISIAVDNDETVFIAYGLSGQPLFVQQFDDSPQVNDWVSVGAADAPFPKNFFTSQGDFDIRTEIFIDNTNRPVVAFLGSDWRGIIYRFNGSEWTSVGGTDGLPDHHRWPSYGLYKAENIYYVSGRARDRKNLIRSFACGPVLQLSPAASEVDAETVATFTVEATGVNISYQWQVNKNDGAGFLNVADGDDYTGTATATLSVTAATVEMNGYQYRAVASSDCGDKASESAVLRVIPPAPVWTGAPISEGRGFWTSMDVDSEGTPYILSDEAGYKVFRRVDGGWSQVGAAITTTAAVQRYIFPTLKVDQEGVPFVAYQNHEDGQKLYVRKWNSEAGTWDLVGTPSAEGVRYTYINFDNNNVPYVFYRSLENENYHYKVIKFVDGAWQQVGPKVGGPTENQTLNITFDNNNVPYVVYQDGSASASIFVKKYNEAADTWDVVGSFGQGSNPYLALDNTDTPYVVYNDAVLNKAVVKKYDGTNWVVVGQTGGISGGGVYSENGTNRIFIGPDNRPYVAFNDGGGKFFVFNGTAWELVGGTNANVGGTGWHNSAMDRNNGVLYFSYRNSSDGGRRVFVYEFKAGPPVNASPQDGEVIEGESITFSGIAAGRNLSYQWQVDEGNGRFVNIPSGSTSYSGVTTSTLKIELATMEMNENKYRMVAIGEWGASATEAAVLTVISSNTCFPPLVGTQPVSLELCPGTNARFMVEPSQGSEPQYQWQVSTDGTTFTNLANGGVYSGVNSKTLTVSGLTNNLNGNLYRAVISAGCSDAQVTSNNATLTVFDRPTIVTQPVAPETVCPGTETAISVGAIGNAITYQWQLSTNGVDFANITNGEIYGGVASSTLVIKVPSSAMNGNMYRVVTAGSCQPQADGNISSPVTLRVYQPLVAGTISGKQSICYNTVPAPLMNTGLASGSNNSNAANYQYQWQSSADNAGWTDISGAEEVDYAPQALSGTTYFRRKVVNIACSQPATAYSEPVKVTVFSDVTPGEIVWTGTGDVAKGSNAAAIESGVDAAGGNIVAYQWESSADGTTFSPIPGATAKDFAPAGVMETLTYRRVATSERGCGTVISNAVTITVRENNFDAAMVPNAVMPNSTSLMNKTWGIKNLHYSGKVSIRVFDIKGNTVFTTEDPAREWDGTYNGGLVPAGTYYYSIENGDKKVGGSLKVIY